LKLGDARLCGCKAVIYIAPTKINTVNPNLQPWTIIKAIDEMSIVGCNRKAIKFKGEQVRFASHIQVHKLSHDVKKLFGGM
jgi:hypothetical protein